MKRTVFGLIVLAIGVMMLCRALGVSDFSWFFNGEWHKYIVPGLIILFGFRLLFTSSNKRNEGNFKLCEVPEQKEGEPLKMSVALSGSAYNFNGETFLGARLDAFMGGINIDLRGADIEDRCVVEAHTFMGGVELKVPQDVNVEIHSSCFLGGVNNKSANSYSSTSKTIILKANCFLGGVDVKN